MASHVVVNALYETPIIGPYVNSIFFAFEFITAFLAHEWLYVRLVNLGMDVEVGSLLLPFFYFSSSLLHGMLTLCCIFRGLCACLSPCLVINRL